MGSYLSWMDHSENARRKMLDIINLFSEKETRDELGIGSVRDAFSDLLFPGTSTIQTRAKYFLFVPWIYQIIEKKEIESADVENYARKIEIRLIDSLMDSNDTQGVIGKQARKNLQRLPSDIYWEGLKRLGILLFRSSKEQYHRSLDYFNLDKKEVYKGDGIFSSKDAESKFIEIKTNWHSGIPKVPNGFPNEVTLKLNKEEATYLAERILYNASGTLFAFLIDQCSPWKEKYAFPWDHPCCRQLPSRIKEQIEHAQNFSMVMWGSALLYNLMLAEKLKSNDEIAKYKFLIKQDWWTMLEKRRSHLNNWRMEEFWQIARSENPRISMLTQRFIETWIKIVLKSSDAKSIVSNEKARKLILEREKDLKGELARLTNRRALENWSGASGGAQIDYRWGKVQQIVLDILSGMKRKE